MEPISCSIMLIVGVICGAISAGIMKGKGRSAGAGWALGLLIGVFGILVAALLPADEANIKASKLQSGQFKKCPYCMEVIDSNARICPHCRSQLG